MAADGQDIVKTYQRWKQARANFDWRWEEMAPFLAPSRSGILNAVAAGAKQTRGVYDSTSVLAAETFSQFLAGRIINPSDRWMSYGMESSRDNAVDAIREWNEESRDRTLKRWLESMFYAEAPESFIDLSAFGTGCLIIDELPEKPNQRSSGFRGFHVQAVKTGRFVIAQGADGMVDSLIRELTVTARVARDRWGMALLTEKMKTALANGKGDTTFQVLHAILPRSLGQMGAGAQGMPWMSAWVEMETKAVLHEGGYRRFPAAVPRDRVTPGEAYGRGRGEIAFPDIWSLNMAKKMGFEDWALKIQPPVLARHDSVLGTLRLVPSGLTIVQTHGQDIRQVVTPWQTGSHPEVSQIKEADLRQSIREIFFVDTIRQLLQVNKSEMTAFEFKNKLDLLFRMVATIYGRLQREFLRQVVDIAWDLQFYEGDFSPPPPEIYRTNGKISVEFENPLARAQRAGDVDALALAFGDLAPVVQLFGPGSLDRLDPDKAVTMIFNTRGVPASVTRNDAEMAAKRQADAQRAAQQQQMQEMMGAAEAAGKAAPLVAAAKQPDEAHAGVAA